MAADVTFHFSLLSPWVYFAGPQFQLVLARTGARADYRPLDVLRLFRESGGTPLSSLPEARRAYRAAERRRWARRLHMPISETPRHHPVDDTAAAGLLIALSREDWEDGRLWSVAQAFLEGVWCRELDISDPATVVGIATEHGVPEAALDFAFSQEAQAAVGANTDQALAAGVFGVPSFVIGDELFFGQDRLDFVEEALSIGATRSAPHPSKENGL